VKGCLLFGVVFLLGVGLIISGVIYDVFVAQNLESRDHAARVLEVSGIAVLFSAVFGAAGYAFYRRLRDPDDRE